MFGYQRQLQRASDLAKQANEQITAHVERCELRWNENKRVLDKILRLIYMGLGMALAIGFLGTPLGAHIAHLLLDIK